MRSPFLKKCHKVRLLLAALCGLSFASHLDAVTKLKDLKSLEADLKSQLAQPTEDVKSVLKRYKALRKEKLQAKSPAEAQQMEAVMSRLAAEVKETKKRDPRTAKNKNERRMLNTLEGMQPVRRPLSSIDIMSGASTPKAAAAKHKPPTLLGGGGHGVQKTPKKPKKMKPAISPKPSPQQIAAHNLKTSHQSVVNAMKTHHAHTEVAAAKANLAKVNAEIAHEEMMESLSEHSSTSPTHTSPTHTPTPEPVAPEPDNETPPAPAPAPTLVPTTPQRPRPTMPSADMLKEGRQQLQPTPKKESPPSTPSSDNSDLQTAIHQQIVGKFANTSSDSEDDDSDWDDSEDEDED